MLRRGREADAVADDNRQSKCAAEAGEVERLIAVVRAKSARRHRGLDDEDVYTGLVGHWGHSHERTNRYHALFTIELVQGAWRITGIEILREERLEIRLIN